MVKKIKMMMWLALMMVSAGVMNGCRELPLIGDLAGQWQITEVVYADGEVVTNPQRYYCFYRHTAQLTAPGGVKVTANMTYEYPDLELEFPKDDLIWLSEWGVLPSEESGSEHVQRYHIDKLDRDHLEMTTEQGVRISLRKY